MSRFRSVGRLAFARGNSSWANNFNANLFAARNNLQWKKTLGVVTPSLMSRMSTLAIAGEAPVGAGFAEQFRDMSSLPVRSEGEGTESEVDSQQAADLCVDSNVEIRNMLNHLGGGCEIIWSSCFQRKDATPQL